MSPEASDFDPAVRRFSGFASTYNAYRPSPPEALLDVLIETAQTERPALVVDLGCGTGLSTRIWAERTERVIGVDPSDDMLREARAQTTAPNITYCSGYSHDTGVPDQSTDIVTCSSSVHWMEPVSTLAEVSRILRPGGVFAAYGHAHPPVFPQWEIEEAFYEYRRGIDTRSKAMEAAEGLKRWSSGEIGARMRESGRFRHVREFNLHKSGAWDADQFIGWMLSHGDTAGLLKQGLSESEIDLDRLRETARRVLGESPRPCYHVYWVKMGVV